MSGTTMTDRMTLRTDEEKSIEMIRMDEKKDGMDEQKDGMDVESSISSPEFFEDCTLKSSKEIMIDHDGPSLMRVIVEMPVTEEEMIINNNNIEGTHWGEKMERKSARLPPPTFDISGDCFFAFFCPCLYIYAVGNEIKPELYGSTMAAFATIILSFFGVPHIAFFCWRNQLITRFRMVEGFENAIMEVVCLICCPCYTLTATGRDLRYFSKLEERGHGRVGPPVVAKRKKDMNDETESNVSHKHKDGNDSDSSASSHKKKKEKKKDDDHHDWHDEHHDDENWHGDHHDDENWHGDHYDDGNWHDDHYDDGNWHGDHYDNGNLHDNEKKDQSPRDNKRKVKK